MKSTEGKVRGRPRKRKNNSAVNNASSTENENNKSFLDFFSPPRTIASNSINSNSNDKRSGSTPRRKQDPLKNLQSNLSPKYIGFSTPTSSDKRFSRYRTTKLSVSGGIPNSYFSSNQGPIGCVRRTTSNGQINSPMSSPEVSLRRSKLFESPIEKLLRKNGARKSLPNSPNCLTSPEFVLNKTLEESASKKMNCVVRLEQMNHGTLEAGGESKNPELQISEMDTEPQFDASTTEHDVASDPVQSEEKENEVHEIDALFSDESHQSIEVRVELGKDDEATVVYVSPCLNPASDPVQSEEKENEVHEIDDLFSDESHQSIEVRVELGKDDEATVVYASPCLNPASDPVKSEEEENEAHEIDAGNELAEIVKALKNDDDETMNEDKTMEAIDEDVVMKEEACVEREVPVAIEKVPEDPVETNKELHCHSPENNVDIPTVKQEEKQVNSCAEPNEAEVVQTFIADEVALPYITLNDQNEPIELASELPENTDNSQQILHANSKFTSEDMISVKSPSTYSVDSAKGSSLDNDLNWVSIETGDLFWGQIYSFAYWPCIVCPDPDGKTISVNESGKNHVMIHVRFFADNGRRSWVKRDNLMSYNGLEHYHKKQKEVEEKYGKKSYKYKLFVVTAKKAKLWNQAVREADLIETVAMEERMQMFFKMVDEVKINNTLERKRRQSFVNSSTSDLCSMFDSNDNLLYLKQANLKRERSPTPVSPAFSPIATKHSEKRIKLNDDVDDDHHHRRPRSMNRSSFMDDLDMNADELQQTVSETTSSELGRMQNEEIYNDPEFKKFVAAMRPFILGNTNDSKQNYKFMVTIRNMWELKHISYRNELEAQNQSSSMKRLSRRIRNISIQKSLPSTPIQNHVQQQQLAIKPPSETKPKTPLNRPIDEVIDDIFNLDSKYLFREVAKEPVCKECLKSGSDLVKCSMNCQTFLHPHCSSNCPAPRLVHITGDFEEEANKLAELPPVICKSCYTDEPSKCSVCKKDAPELGEMARCNSNQCSKLYHPACLRYWPQAKMTKSSGKLESLRCPVHVCHTCVSDDPKGKFLHIEKSKLTKCIKCPATYHMDSTCIPAGSQFLTASWIICPRHYNRQKDQLLNVDWCFICVAGGKLICCETCPTAVHAECLKIPVADEGYICEECETGRMPLYGEMVWAKFRNFRWWPSLILPPTEVPLNLANKPHMPSQFVVRFFGSNDHGWISRRRVYLYQEGDGCEPPSSQKVGIDYDYTMGVKEAKRIAELIKEKKMIQRTNDKKQRISPLPYVKIKSNRAVPPIKLLVDYEKISKCDCDKDSANPCAQDTDCLNRVLYNECNPKICPAGERCQNQMFEKKLYPKLEVWHMKEKGFGLICLEPISAGTFVIEYVGEVIDDAEFRRRIAQKEQERDENFYFLSLEKDYIIDAGPKGNLARFMNHSCEPNCETQKWSVNGLDRIGLFAIKDIPKNTELTFNYYWDELLGNEKKNCHCGAAKCAGVIGGKYKEPAKELPPPQVQKLKNRRMTTAKAKSQKPRRPKPKSEATTKKATTKLPSKLNTSNPPSLATDTTTPLEIEIHHPSPSTSRNTSPKTPKRSSPESMEEESTIQSPVTSTLT